MVIVREGTAAGRPLLLPMHVFFAAPCLFMSLFGNNTSSDESSASLMTSSSDVQDQVNLVGQDTILEGTIRAESNVRVSGQIHGTLEVKGKILVAEEGTVEGELVATDAEIAGEVQGEIHVKERLVLKSTAVIDGLIQTDRLVVEVGAEFTGECKMGEPVAETRELDGERAPGMLSKGDAGATTEVPEELPKA